MTYHLQKGCGYGHVTVQFLPFAVMQGVARLSATSELLVNFGAPNDISGTTEAMAAKFCMQVEYVKC